MATGKAESRRAEARSAEDRALARDSAVAAKTPTFFEQKAEEEFKAHDAWKNAKDFRRAPPGMISLGYGDVDQRNRMRERTFNMADTGISALGGAGNATALKMAEMNRRGEFERDQAASYERAVTAEDDYQRKGAAPQWADMANSRSLNIAQLYNSTAQNSAQLAAELRPRSLLPGLISGLMGGASAYAGAQNKHPAVIQSERLRTQQDYQKFFGS